MSRTIQKGNKMSRAELFRRAVKLNKLRKKKSPEYNACLLKMLDTVVEIMLIDLDAMLAVHEGKADLGHLLITFDAIIAAVISDLQLPESAAYMYKKFVEKAKKQHPDRISLPEGEE